MSNSKKVVVDDNSVRIFKIHPDAVIPKTHTGESVGFDLCCVEGFTISPNQRVVVSTGLVVKPPKGYHTEILVRSSMAFKHGIMLTNNVGLIDRDYSGAEDEIKVMLFMVEPNKVTTNKNIVISSSLQVASDVTFNKGDRIAQMVFRKSHILPILEVDAPPSDNDRGGFGSTGK